MGMDVNRTEKKVFQKSNKYRITPQSKHSSRENTLHQKTPETRGLSLSVCFLRGASSAWQEINSKRCNLIEIASTLRAKYSPESKPHWEFISDAEDPHPVRRHGQELPDGDGLEQKWPLETSFSLVNDKHLVKSDKCLFLSTVSYLLFRKRFCLMKVKMCHPEAISTQKELDSELLKHTWQHRSGVEPNSW